MTGANIAKGLGRVSDGARIVAGPNDLNKAITALTGGSAIDFEGASGADAGVPAHYGNPFGEQRALASGSALAEVPRGVVTVTGPVVPPSLVAVHG